MADTAAVAVPGEQQEDSGGEEEEEEEEEEGRGGRRTPGTSKNRHRQLNGLINPDLRHLKSLHSSRPEQRTAAPNGLGEEALPPLLAACTVHDIRYVRYQSELQMPDIMRLITRDLSEPYSIYTYRYFIHNWPQLCFLVSLLRQDYSSQRALLLLGLDYSTQRALLLLGQEDYSSQRSLTGPSALSILCHVSAWGLHLPECSTVQVM